MCSFQRLKEFYIHFGSALPSHLNIKLSAPFTFLTSVGSEIKLKNFYVQDDMFHPMNICKFAMSELGVKWDLKDEFVYIKNEKIPLLPYN